MYYLGKKENNKIKKGVKLNMEKNRMNNDSKKENKNKYKSESTNGNEEAIKKLSYGLYILTARKNGMDNGCIIDVAFQVTADPRRICIAVNKGSLTHDMVRDTGKFTLSVVSKETDFDIVKWFGYQSGRDVDKFKYFKDCREACNDTKYITKDTNAYLCGDVINSIDLGTHTLFIAEVSYMEVLGDAPSATYHYYHKKMFKAEE
jgi:flavin reductase (DIM6/NTAB) family NADH-FMN oxidoreductase RutF